MCKSIHRLVKANLAYNGASYSGWQIQDRELTIQSVVEKALFKIHHHAIRVFAASRTDRGVHAQGQVIHFQSDSHLSDSRLKRAFNFHLPSNVCVVLLRTLRGPFHARFDAKSKFYRYVIYTGKMKPIFKEPFVAWRPYP